MKIAIPTNDKETITSRTGRCKEFAVYEIENSIAKNIDYLENNHEHNHDHEHGEEHEHSHSNVIELLKNIDLLVVVKVGKHMKNDLVEGNVNFSITEEKNIVNILNNIIKIEKIREELKKIKHPAIDLSLIELGLVQKIGIKDKVVSVLFKFPFPNIPIADKLISSISNSVEKLGYTLSHNIETMTEQEKQTFLALEGQNWKGM